MEFKKLVKKTHFNTFSLLYCFQIMLKRNCLTNLAISLFQKVCILSMTQLHCRATAKDSGAEELKTVRGFSQEAHRRLVGLAPAELTEEKTACHGILFFLRHHAAKCDAMRCYAMSHIQQ